ncbi:DUF5131 family protein [Methylibium sp.]|uniref:DUF5131 family protein n=1 Tax=Methylibium sp. TaxID=2067992 RepID=UPI003D13E36E
MADHTHIEWTDATWNPVTGCREVSPGCKNCYAKRDWQRLSAPRAVPNAYTGREFHDVQFHPERLHQPSQWKKPRRIFVNSMSDLFHEDVADQQIEAVFAEMQANERHTFQALTKRIVRAKAWLDRVKPSPVDGILTLDGAPPRHHGGVAVAFMAASWPLRNVWLGITVVNQAEADRDIPVLLATPARVRFLSVEPMLGPVDLQRACLGACRNGATCYADEGRRWIVDSTEGGLHVECICSRLNGLHWVIAGGESGPHARPSHPDWFRSLRDQCAAAGVPFLFKQWGEWLPIDQQDEAFTDRLYRSNRKAAPHEDQAAVDDTCGRTCSVPYGVIHHDGSFHEPLEPMAFLQGTGAMTTFKVGKKPAGRLLDGALHDAYPEVR